MAKQTGAGAEGNKATPKTHFTLKKVRCKVGKGEERQFPAAQALDLLKRSAVRPQSSGWELAEEGYHFDGNEIARK